MNPKPHSEIEALWGESDSLVEYDPEFSPAIESPPAMRSRKELDRVLNILDEVQVEKLDRKSVV